MSAPFELPDLATLYRDGETEPYAENVPCRQVPAYARGGGTRYESDVALYTHWVDFNSNVEIRDGTEINYPKQLLEAPGDRIVILTEACFLMLSILFIEDRYTNTERNYLRAYCTRIVRAPL